MLVHFDESNFLVNLTAEVYFFIFSNIHVQDSQVKPTTPHATKETSFVQIRGENKKAEERKTGWGLGSIGRGVGGVGGGAKPDVAMSRLGRWRGNACCSLFPLLGPLGSMNVTRAERTFTSFAGAEVTFWCRIFSLGVLDMFRSCANAVSFFVRTSKFCGKVER